MDISKSLRSSIVLFFSVLAGTFTLQFTFVECYKTFNPGWELAEKLGDLGVYIIIIHALLAAFIAVFIKYYFRNKEDNSDQIVEAIVDDAKSLDDLMVEVLLKFMHESFSNKEYGEVIRLGSVFSRPLWLLGQYNSRIENGKLVEEAASILGKPAAQASALIDDVGWTNVKLKKYDAAESAINFGIEVAQSNELHYLLCKGYRHLGSLARQKNDLSEARRLYSLSLTHSINIIDSSKKLEMSAGIEFAEGNLFIVEKKLDEAEKKHISALEKYQKLDDSSRIVKVYNAIGIINVKKDKFIQAKDYLRKALKIGREFDRRDETIKSLIGLSIIYDREGNRLKHQEYFEEASALATILEANIWEVRNLFLN